MTSEFTKAIVTGGAGFIGSNLVDRLVDEGVDLLVVDDLSSGSLSRIADARRRGPERRGRGRKTGLVTGSVSVLFCTCPPDAAERIARELIERRLAACVNVVPNLVSIYRWKGRLERDAEALYHLTMGWMQARILEGGGASRADAAALETFALAGLTRAAIGGLTRNAIGAEECG